MTTNGRGLIVYHKFNWLAGFWKALKIVTVLAALSLPHAESSPQHILGTPEISNSVFLDPSDRPFFQPRLVQSILIMTSDFFRTDRRYEACRTLNASEVPCAIWFEDAIAYYGVTTVLFDLYMLVHDIDAAARVLNKAGWVLAPRKAKVGNASIG